ncbi:MAG: FAD-dependent oxidoreductase [Myxococcota bacterium]
MKLPSPWFRSEDALTASSPDALPATIDVLIIGGGLAGLSAAAMLAEAGVRVALIEARDRLAASISGRAHGNALVGLADDPLRLKRAIGETATREILQFSLQNLDMIDEMGLLDRTGCLAATLFDEVKEVEDIVDTSSALGLPATLWSAERVNDTLHGIGFGPGRFTPAEGRLDPAALSQRLADRARAAGAVLATHARLVDTRDTPNGVVATLHTGQTLSAEILVLAAGWSLQQLDPWLGDKLYPVRTQMMRLTAPPDRFATACTAQYGFTFWRQFDASSVVFGGCRWVTPEMEAGETDDTVVSPRIAEMQRKVLQQRFPDLAAHPPIDAWTGIMTFSCDGLPIVGPIPGRPRYVVCAGFNGRQTGLAVRAARAITDGILRGRADGVPRYFTPGRFVTG